MSARIVDRDKGYAQFLKRIAQRHMRLGVGVPLASPKGKIAAYLHDGTSRMLARPFLAQWFDRWASKNIGLIFEVYLLVVARRIWSYEKALERVGPKLVDGLRAEMRSGNFAPLAPSTIARKGSSLPLVDTGELVGDATYVVKKG